MSINIKTNLNKYPYKFIHEEQVSLILGSKDRLTSDNIFNNS